MNPLNGTLGLLICLFSPSVSAQAQDSIKEPTRSVSGIAITANVQPALIAQIHDAQGHLENSVASLGTVDKSVLTFEVGNDLDLTLRTPEGVLYLRRIEITVRFSGFSTEMGRINLTAPQSTTTSLVEGASPESVIPIDPDTSKPVSNAVRSGDRLVRYVGFRVPMPSDVARLELPKFELRYEVAIPPH